MLVIETSVNSGLTVACKIVLDHVAYENKARGVKCVKIQNLLSVQ